MALGAFKIASSHNDQGRSLNNLKGLNTALFVLSMRNKFANFYTVEKLINKASVFINKHISIVLYLPILISFNSILGCTSISVDNRISHANDLSARNGFEKKIIQTNRFQLTSFIRMQHSNSTSQKLHIYIEGDGFAWVTRTQPSDNPTPIEPTALKLAILDKTPSVAYLGRPCQFISGVNIDCDKRYWTSARFSPEVIDDINQAIDQLKWKAGVENISLIGYSGGGTIAALISAKRNDVLELITIAGNLDHKTWRSLHFVSPLYESLNPPDYWKSLLYLNQIHLVGENDQIVPLEVYQAYRKAFPPDANIHLKIIPHIDHSCCWEEAWQNFLKNFD